MPQREDQVSSVPLLTIGGVNQRVNKREIEDHEYSWHSGVAPVFSGSQTRLWGKSLLAAFGLPILGIYQAWNPMGYGLGLFQFDGSLDAGIWQSPLSGIVLPPLDVSLPFDLAGYTYDEFNYSVGQNFGYAPLNTCLLSFLDGSSNHTACGPPISNLAPVDTTSGNPAGHGQKCKVTQHMTSYSIANFATLQQSASGSYNNEVGLDNIGTPPTCVLPPPTPSPLGGPCPVGAWVNVSPINSSLVASQDLNSAIFYFVGPTNPLCNFKAVYGPTGSATDTQYNLDFSSLVGLNLPLPTRVALVVTTSPGGTGEVPLDVDFGPGGNYASYTLTASQFLPTGTPTPNLDNGLTMNTSVTAGTINVYTNSRVCTPNA